MINEERVLKRFLKYVQIDSESYNERQFARVLSDELIDIGLEVEIDNSGDIVGSNTGNIIARLKGNTEGDAILFSCHMDTVAPGKNIKPIIKDGVIYSDGTTILGGDDKGGIASIVEALTVIKENNIKHPTIELVFTIAEEVGLYGSKNIDYSKLTAKKGYIFDTSGDPGIVVIKGPAQDKISVKITGKPAHAGVAPENGVSAIQIAAEAINNMKLLRIDENTTANIGTISGGTAVNIVCPEIKIEAEARSTVVECLDAQTKHMIEEFEKAAIRFCGSVEFNVERLYGPFVIEETDEVVQQAKRAFESLGIKAETKSSGGGSDTNIFNCNGIKAVNLASGERNPHTLQESVKIEDLYTVSRVVLALINENLK